MDKLNTTVEFFKQYGKCIKPYKTMQTNEFNRFPPIICKDGLFISAQAGENYKCYPRENLDDFEYETVEIHRHEDTDAEELLHIFICDYDKYILDNVPVSILDAVIEKHGGIDYNKVDDYIKNYDD